MKLLTLDATRRSTPTRVAPAQIPGFLPNFLSPQTHANMKEVGPAMRAFQWLLRGLIYVILRPRKGDVGALHQAEVDSIYYREAASYDVKHHLTTHGMDTQWRRMAGWCVATYARERKKYLHVLDLCTGTGLSVAEILRVMDEWNIQGMLTGVDYNTSMLAYARRLKYTSGSASYAFLRADATKLTSGPIGFATFEKETQDVVTQVFGIGGIEYPTHVFEEVLKVLVPGGRYVLVDMHRPISSQPGEMFTPFGWMKSPRLEAITYAETTIPLALKRLWGWRDTTWDFYQLPYVTWEDGTGACWGFRVIHFVVESERWWFGLPVMPTGKIVVEKMRITLAERDAREVMLRTLEH